jgi:hypothetical protein
VVSERRAFAAVLVLGAGLTSQAALAATDAERKLSPKAFYNALLKTPTPALLPDGYQTTRIASVPASPTAKRHHVVGEVAVLSTKRGTAGARILYIVFPTRAAALADWKDRARWLPSNRLPPPAFLPKPSVMFSAQARVKNSAGKLLLYGTTTLAYVTGNVVVEVDTSSATSTVRGDILGAIALAQFARRHLATVERQAAPAKPVSKDLPPPPVV